jgi:hypothetical protein
LFAVRLGKTGEDVLADDRAFKLGEHPQADSP